MICVGGSTKDPVRPEAAPPKLVLLVYQKFSFDKTAERGQWETATARAFANLEVPNSWIVLESVTGEQEVLSFDPFDSFAHINKAFAEWGPIFAAHPELAKLQAQIWHQAKTARRRHRAQRKGQHHPARVCRIPRLRLRCPKARYAIGGQLRWARCAVLFSPVRSEIVAVGLPSAGWAATLRASTATHAPDWGAFVRCAVLRLERRTLLFPQHRLPFPERD
jgi:hypothetical protein